MFSTVSQSVLELSTLSFHSRTAFPKVSLQQLSVSAEVHTSATSPYVKPISRFSPGCSTNLPMSVCSHDQQHCGLSPRRVTLHCYSSSVRLFRCHCKRDSLFTFRTDEADQTLSAQRLALKYYITRRQGSKSKPERDPHWLEKQEDFKYDNKSKGLHRYGTPRINSESSANDSSSSSQGAVESHRNRLARRALLPLPSRKRDDLNLPANATFLEEQNRRRKLKQNEGELEERRRIVLEQIGELGELDERDRKLNKVQERLKRTAPRSVVSLRRDRSRRRDSARGSLERSSDEGSDLSWSDGGSSLSSEEKDVRSRR